MLKYAEIAQNIIDAHPESVHQLLRAHGITKKATPEVLKDAYILFGKPFIGELTNMIHKAKQSNFSDFFVSPMVQQIKPISPVNTSPLPAPKPVSVSPVSSTFETSIASATEKKTIWDGLANVFDSVVNIASKVSTVTGAVANTAQTAKDIVQPANGQPNVFQLEEKKALEEAENKKFTRNLLIVSAIVIIVLISLIVITRKK